MGSGECRKVPERESADCAEDCYSHPRVLLEMHDSETSNIVHILSGCMMEDNLLLLRNFRNENKSDVLAK